MIRKLDKYLCWNRYGKQAVAVLANFNRNKTEGNKFRFRN